MQPGRSFPPTVCVCNLSGKGYIRERVVVLWEVLTASSLLPPTAEEVLMKEDFKEKGRWGEKEWVWMSTFLTPFLGGNKSARSSHLAIAILKCINLWCKKKGQFYCSIAQIDQNIIIIYKGLLGCWSITMTQCLLCRLLRVFFLRFSNGHWWKDVSEICCFGAHSSIAKSVVKPKKSITIWYYYYYYSADFYPF